jgi:hypothetical protein
MVVVSTDQEAVTSVEISAAGGGLAVVELQGDW